MAVSGTREDLRLAVKLSQCFDAAHVMSECCGRGPPRLAKRQRSEPTTPISTSSRLPYEYDEVMGITQVDPREAERFDEGLDLEYPSVPELLCEFMRRHTLP